MKGRKNTVKFWVGQLHLWLGLTSGLIVIFLGITGCILAFEREIEIAVQPYRFVEAQDKPFLLPSKIKTIANQALPGKMAHSVTYEGKENAAIVVYYHDDPEYYYTAFINPYSGEVLKVKNMDDDFFRIVIMGHYYLWLPPTVGQPILASATLIFVIMLVSGMILWWPKNRSAAKQRFSIKWGARWRRVNYDMHNVLGFYATWVVIFIALSGLIMGFQWFSKSVYWVASGGGSAVEFSEPKSDTELKGKKMDLPAMDQVYYFMKDAYAGPGSIEVHYPENDTVAIAGAANPDVTTYWRADYRYFDQYTLKEMPVDHMFGRFKNLTVADKIMRMNYDIHVGAIAGLPGKIMAFFGSLIAASLPVTGFAIWWGRRKQSKSPRSIMGLKRKKRHISEPISK